MVPSTFKHAKRASPGAHHQQMRAGYLPKENKPFKDVLLKMCSQSTMPGLTTSFETICTYQKSRLFPGKFLGKQGPHRSYLLLCCSICTSLETTYRNGLEDQPVLLAVRQAAYTLTMPPYSKGRPAHDLQ